MKRSLVLSVCAAAIVACFTHSALAVVDVQLKLTYTHPADPSQGGTWELLTQSDATQGVAGVRVVIGGVDIAATENGDVFDNTDSVFRFSEFGGGLEVVAGDNLAGDLITGVGTAGGPGDQGADDLVGGNPIWDNSSLLASGTFSTATRPSLLEVDASNGNVMAGTGVFAIANEFISDTPTQATIGDVSVRGDSLNTLGLESPAGAGLTAGDANRDGRVGAADSAALFSNWDPLGTTRGWDQGDFDGAGAVGAADSAALFSSWDPLGGNANPPAIAAVPEPSSLLLLGMAIAGLSASRRRSQ